MDWLTLRLLGQERHKDLQREAERERLVRQALAQRDGGQNLYRRALTWLGRGLVAWGQRWQERYGPVMEAPALKPPRYSR